MIFISILILIVAKAIPSLNKKISTANFTRISTIIFIYAGVLTLNTLYIQSIGSGIGIYSGLFQVTVISQFIEICLLFIGSIILIAWPIYSKNNNININSLILINTNKTNDLEIESNLEKGSLSLSPEYSLIALFSTLGSCLLISSSDIVSMYLSIELQSFGVYVLTTLYKDSESSTRAGLKYFLLGALSSCLILLGSGLIYAFTGLTNFESIYSLVSVSESNSIIQGLSLGLILIVVGLLFKIAAAPLHNWSPDVYDETPTIVTIWLTIMPKIGVLILLLELYNQIGIGSIISLNNLTLEPLINNSINENINVLKTLLLISSMLSLIIGTVVGLAQTRIKRLLAYSTISHIGFILLSLAINTEQSIESLLFYIIQYSLTNLNVFLIIIALGYIIQTSKSNNNNNFNLNNIKNNEVTVTIIKDLREISDLKGQFFSNPLLSLSLSICLFSMAGIPPLIGFFAKQFVLYSALGTGYYFMSILGILVSVISASYYLKIIKVLNTETEENIDRNLQLQNNNINNINKEIELEFNNNYNYNYNNKIKDFNINSNYVITLSNLHSFLISTLTLSILFFIFKPSLILNSTQLLSLSLFNF